MTARFPLSSATRSRRLRRRPPVASVVQVLLCVGYVGVVFALLYLPQLDLDLRQPFTPPLVFWTVALPLLPLALIFGGFSIWRRVCPLALWGELGRRASRGKPKSPPRWIERWFPVVSLLALAVSLCLRHLCTNGDGPALGMFLILLGSVAALVNFAFGGKTWCNLFCPVLIVERIYTDPKPLRDTVNSQCDQCTACKKNCPDIDQENSYWKNLGLGAIRGSYFAFPGLVLGFYVYFWLRAGDWDAYFGGGWTQPMNRNDLFAGPGFFFAPEVPAYAAVPLTLSVFMLSSLLLFRGLERAAGRWSVDPETLRHRMLTIAAFTAFNLFYAFAGAPTISQLPFGTRSVAFFIPALSAVLLVGRFSHSRKQFVMERSAGLIARRWKFTGPLPNDPQGIFSQLNEEEATYEEHLAIYRETVRSLRSDGLVSQGDPTLVELVRNALGISESDHHRIWDQLGFEEVGEPVSDRDAGAERSLQANGYRKSLADAIARGASDAELTELRRTFAIGPAQHERISAELEDSSLVTMDRVRKTLRGIREIRQQLRNMSSCREPKAFEFATFILLRNQRDALKSVLDTLAAEGGGASSRSLVSGIVSKDEDRRRSGFRELRERFPSEIAESIEEIMVDPLPTTTPAKSRPLTESILWLFDHDDPFLRAGALHAIGVLKIRALFAPAQAGLSDHHVLVSEMARWATSSIPLEPERGELPEDASHPESDDAHATLSIVEKILLVRCTSLFADLEPDDLFALCSIASERLIPEGWAFCEKGAVSDEFQVIVSGTASVIVPAFERGGFAAEARDELEKEVAELGPGDVVGGIAAFDESIHRADVRAKGGAVRLLQIRGEDFRKCVAIRQGVAPRIMSVLSTRLRETLERVR